MEHDPRLRLIRIGMASLNTTVGAFASNVDAAIQAALEMEGLGCHVGLFPEQTIPGYPSEDLVQWRGYVDEQWKELRRFTQETSRCRTLFTVGLTVIRRGQPYNVAAMVHGGRVIGLTPKKHLPTYGIFHEGRNVSPGWDGLADEINNTPFGDLVYDTPMGRIGQNVCEDIWSDKVTGDQAKHGVELVLNGSSSPFRTGVVDTRREMLRTRSADNECTIAYCNQLGGQGALVFDGGGFVVQNGAPVFEAHRWSDRVQTCVVNLDKTGRRRAENTTWRREAAEFEQAHGPRPIVVQVQAWWNEGAPEAECPVPGFMPAPHIGLEPVAAYFNDLTHAMVYGLADYVRKTGAFKRVVLGLSGGKDSALVAIVAALAADHLKVDRKDFVRCYSMPTKFNSAVTRNAARVLAEGLGVSFVEMPIGDLVDLTAARVKEMRGGDEPLKRNTGHNNQARIRAELLWNLANELDALFLQTSNESEKAVGYSTIGGDGEGGLAIIANLPKTVIIALLRHLSMQGPQRGERYYPGLGELVAITSSAELEEGQSDEADLMPFEVLDDCLQLFAGEKLLPAAMYKALRAKHTGYKPGELKTWVRRFCLLFIRNIWKWVQAPESLHLGSLDLDRERAFHLPTVQSTEWLKLDELDKLPD